MEEINQSTIEIDKMVEKIYFIIDKINENIDIVNFGNFQNIILGLLAVLLPMFIYIYEKYDNAAIIKQFFSVIKLSILVTISLFLLSFEIKNEDFKWIKVFPFLFSLGTIFYLIRVIYQIYEKIITKPENKVLRWVLLEKKIDWEDKIEIWKKYFNSCNLRPNNEEEFLKLYNKDFESIVKGKAENKQRILRDFLEIYNNHNIEFFKIHHIDKVDNNKNIAYKKYYYYSDIFFEKSIELYIDNKDDSIDYALSENYKKVIKNTISLEGGEIYKIWDSIKEIEKNKSEEINKNEQDSKKYEEIISSFLNKIISDKNFFDIEYEKIKDFYLVEISDELIRAIGDSNNENNDKKSYFNSYIFYYFYRYFWEGIVGNSFKTKEEKNINKVLNTIFISFDKRVIYEFFYFIKNDFEVDERKIYNNSVNRLKTASFMFLEKGFYEYYWQHIISSIEKKDEKFYKKNLSGTRCNVERLKSILEWWKKNIKIEKNDSENLKRNKKQYKKLFEDFKIYLDKKEHICK